MFYFYTSKWNARNDTKQKETQEQHHFFPAFSTIPLSSVSFAAS